MSDCQDGRNGSSPGFAGFMSNIERDLSPAGSATGLDSIGSHGGNITTPPTSVAGDLGDNTAAPGAVGNLQVAAAAAADEMPDPRNPANRDPQHPSTSGIGPTAGSAGATNTAEPAGTSSQPAYPANPQDRAATLKMMRPTRLTAIQTPYTPKGYQPNPQLVVPPSPRSMFGLTELSAMKSGVNRFLLKFAAHSIQEQVFQAQKLDLLVKELKVVAQTDQDKNRVAVMQTHTAIILETMKLLLDQTSK